MPARLAKKNDEPSKYCSDECGVLFFREVMARTRGAEDRDHVRKGSRKSASHKHDVDVERRALHIERVGD